MEALNRKVTTNCPKVIHAICRILLLISFKYSSEPAAKAINARAISLMKSRFLCAPLGNICKTNGPAIIPIKSIPVINGSPTFWNSNDTLFAAIAIRRKAAKNMIVWLIKVKGFSFLVNIEKFSKRIY